MAALHGFRLEFIELGPVPVITVCARGRLTHQDYLAFMPQLEAAINEQTGDRVRMVFDARDLVGWEPGALLDDLRVGLRHGRQLDRVALVTDARWLSILSQLADVLMPGELRSFGDRAEAEAWVQA